MERERGTSQRTSPLALCGQAPGKVLDEPLCAVTTALASPGDWWQSLFEPGELPAPAEG